MTPAEIFQQLPTYFQPDQAGNLNATYFFDLSGPNGGQYWVKIENGKVATSSGTVPDPTVTFTMADTVFVDVIEGRLNPIMAFMQGQLKFSGDQSVAMRLTSLFKRP